MTVPRLLATAVASDPGRPFLTFYDETTGERIELSVATTANWVAKTSNLLQDLLGTDDSSVIHVDLPLHWEAAVWLLACWNAGAAVALTPPSDIAVVGPGGWVDVEAEDVVALSLRPMAARFNEALPVGVIDYNAEVLGFGDHFGAYYPPAPDTAALTGPDAATHAQLIERCRPLLEPGARALVVGDVGVYAQVTGVVAALVANGSLVLVRTADPLSDERRAALVEAERITTELT